MSSAIPTSVPAVNSAIVLAVVFPGQGSQKPGMGKELYENFPESKAVFDAVSRATGLDLTQICFELDEDTLRLTHNAQIALYTVALAALRALEAVKVPHPAAYAGHSVGEYAAVVASGALSVEDGARLVQKRGELMAAAKQGAMAAVLGLERNALQAVLDKISGVVVIANDNCPGQLVISGEPAAVADACAKATESGAKRALPLNVSGAFHSPLMNDAANAMGEALRGVNFHLQETVVYANVTAGPVRESSAWPSLLERQLKSPVRWTESIQEMSANGMTCFVECGPGDVLTGLLKRIDREVTGYSAGTPDAVNAVANALKG